MKKNGLSFKSGVRRQKVDVVFHKKGQVTPLYR